VKRGRSPRHFFVCVVLSCFVLLCVVFALCCLAFVYNIVLSCFVLSCFVLSFLSSEVAIGAKHRAFSFIFTLMTRESVIRLPHYRNVHPDARALTYGQDPVQKCTHCCWDPQHKWNPPQSHVYKECGRRGEETRNDMISKIRQPKP
jgi:hypothetical protein